MPPQNRWLYFGENDAQDGKEFLLFLLNKMPERFTAKARGAAMAFFEREGKEGRDPSITCNNEAKVEERYTCKYPSASGMLPFCGGIIDDKFVLKTQSDAIVVERRRLVEVGYYSLIGLNVLLLLSLTAGVCFVCYQGNSKRHRPRQPIRW